MSSPRPRSPPQNLERPRAGAVQTSNRPLPPPRDRASTVSEARTPQRRRSRHDDGHISPPMNDENNPAASAPQGLEGPLTPNGERQTLQEFLQGLDRAARDGRQDRPNNHRHSMGALRYDGTMSSRNSRYAEEAMSRRRSSTMAGIDSTTAGGYPQVHSRGQVSPIPSSPPPSYEQGNYQAPGTHEDRREPHPGRRVSVDNLSSSFYLKPKWQPDAAVTECPICRRAFGFFYRKHHCRKCGRVVCANCSPHRITIPKQYIVEPPAEGSEGEQEETLRAGMTDAGDEESAMFGGQEVRLCNPCVPDPNPLPHPEYIGHAYAGTAQGILTTFPPQGFDHEQAATQSPQRPRYPRRSSSQRDWVGAYGPNQPPELSRQRSSTDPHGRSGRAISPTGLRRRAQYFPSIESATGDAQALGLHAAVQRRSGSHRHRSHASTSMLPYQQGGHDRNAPLPPIPRQQTPPRQIAEEDECPICHEELPPKGPDGDETAREEHVSQCIANHSASGARSVPPASPAVEGMPGASASSAPQSSNFLASSHGAAASSSSSRPTRPRAETRGSSNFFRRANMLVYHASEKDCLDTEGRQKECVICLEDFVVGTELGRLECLCVFHRTCIRRWWDTRGLGACPTHQEGTESN